MITTGNCLDWLPTIRDAALVYADPPFGIGWKYDEYKDVGGDAYLSFTRDWIAAAKDSLASDGSLFISISDEFAAEVVVEAKRQGLILRNWLIWSYNFGPHLTSKWGRNKTHVLYFCKGSKRIWNPVREQSERQRLGDKRANPDGRVPGDVWDFPRVCGNFKERTDHPCQQNLALVERVVLSVTEPGMLVIDPYSGSGTTGVACVRHGRQFQGCELSATYAEAARQRIVEAI